jgi:hypothetical protein
MTLRSSNPRAIDQCWDHTRRSSGVSDAAAIAEGWLLVADAARILRMSSEGVRKLVATGQLPCTWTHSRTRRVRLFREEDVRALAHRRADAPLVTTRPAGSRRTAQLKLFGAQVRLFRPRVRG